MPQSVAYPHVYFIKFVHVCTSLVFVVEETLYNVQQYYSLTTTIYICTCSHVLKIDNKDNSSYILYTYLQHSIYYNKTAISTTTFAQASLAYNQSFAFFF